MGNGSSRLGSRVLDAVEWIGNRIPEPAVLFAVFAGIVVVVAAAVGVVVFAWQSSRSSHRSCLELSRLLRRP